MCILVICNSIATFAHTYTHAAMHAHTQTFTNKHAHKYTHTSNYTIHKLLGYSYRTIAELAVLGFPILSY